MRANVGAANPVNYSCTAFARAVWDKVSLGDRDTSDDSRWRIGLSCLPVTGIVMLFINTVSRLNALPYLGLHYRSAEYMQREQRYFIYGGSSFISTAAITGIALACGILPINAILVPVTLIGYGGFFVWAST